MREWNEIEKGFNFNEDEEEEIRLEEEIIMASVKAREKRKLSQRKLSDLSGIPQTTIARIERNAVTPQISTLIKYLNALGYRLKVVPKDKYYNAYEKDLLELKVSEDSEEYKV